MNKIRNAASTNEKDKDTPKAPETADASTSTSDLGYMAFLFHFINILDCAESPCFQCLPESVVAWAQNTSFISDTMQIQHDVHFFQSVRIQYLIVN